MNQLPKNDIFKAPEGYFEALPERIISSKKSRVIQVFIARVASAAILVIAGSLFILNQSQPNDVALQTEMDQEVEFYINSGFWNAEDVLGFSEDPNQLLDLIIAEEWSSYSVNDNKREDTLMLTH